MKLSKIILGMAVVAVAGVNAFNTSVEQNKISDLQMENVESLAEAQEVNKDCPNGCWKNGNGCTCNGFFPQLREAEW